MTDTKKKEGKRAGTLYLGMIYNLLLGIVLGLVVYLLIRLPASYVINHYYVTDEKHQERCADYLASLQDYVTAANIGREDTDEIAEWIRGNPYVFLLVYQNPDQNSQSYQGDMIAPGAKDKLIELSGTRIDSSISRDQLISSARFNGYTRIDLTDGIVIVAITEFTENLYYTTTNLAAIFTACLTFVLMLVRYIHVIIDRVKRFESDVTIVSEINMDYEIITEGNDELTRLSGNVENMRRTMLDNIKSEQEAREANTALITSISHDLRTPLTVLMGYIEMMKERDVDDEVMKSYIAATESTALRLKHLSDDMFKYSLAFGDTKKSVKLEEYDAITLFDQLLSEHILLLAEKGYDVRTEAFGEPIKEGSTVFTDPTNLMRIIDNVFSNLYKYADPGSPVVLSKGVIDGRLTIICNNKIRKNTEDAESNGIGLKTCIRLGSIIAEKFEYENDGDSFTCRLSLKIKKGEGENDKL